MGFQINTNVSALNTYRNLSSTQNSMSKSLEKLSSGLRINRAADDAAGLTISEGIKSQVNGLAVASRNAQDGISVVQTADGALGEAQTVLQRLRDLAVQAGNDSNSDEARTAISTEATSLVSELDRIGKSVNFNGKNLLDGSTSNMSFQVGADGDTQSQVSLNLSGANLVSVASSLSASGKTTFTTDDTKVTSLTAASTFTSTKGGVATSVSVDISSTTSVASAVDALNSNAAFSSKFSAVLVKDNAGVTTGFSVAAKDGGVVSVDATSAGAGALGAGVATSAAISFGSASAAQSSINAIDAQINAVSTQRSALGALQNRFESAINTIAVSSENLTAARSRITDVDMAKEMVNYTRSQILSQSGTAMLAQANQGPQLALQLLRG